MLNMLQHPVFIFIFTALPIAFCLFDILNEQQLLHLFGTASKSNAPHYWIDAPSKGFDTDGLYYTIILDGETYRFRLSKYNQLISQGFQSVIRNGNSEEPFQMDTSCIYRGESVSHNSTSIALVGCGSKMRGLIVSNGEHYLVHPHFTNVSSSHVIHKRSLHTHDGNCAFNAKDDPFPEDRLVTSIFGGSSDRLAAMKELELVVELAVFIDDALWMHFQKLYDAEADSELQKFVLAVVNNIDALYQHSSIEPKIRVKITRFEVMKMPPVEMSRNLHSSGDVDRLLDVFCKYQNSMNPIDDNDPHHWDHALLFSGYDLYRGSTRTIAGYAAVKGMCTQKRSCTINEGLDFGSVFVVTHEMGHSLGMYHDGDNRCDLRCCIMSPSVGSGKTSWSECSVRELNLFVMQLGQKGRPENCLIDGTHPLNGPPLNVRSGQEFTLDEQCVFFHGECWRHELKEGQDLSDVCKMVWCGNGEGVIRSAHPALEGTFCGEEMWCIEGKCIKTNSYETPRVDGAWSAWNDLGSPSCSSDCVQCSIAGQIRVRRSTRQCSKPYPNNGGQDCAGDSARGIRCHDDRCNGVTVDEYATQECTKQRDNDYSNLVQLTGKGYQYGEDLCKVWCVIPGDRIRTISNFPDGTPCGDDRYCIKGQCRPLLCGGRAIVQSAAECPSRTLRDDAFETKNNVFLYDKVVTHTRSSQANRLTHGSWSSWSSWSQCLATHCHQSGIRVRQRSCNSGICPGANRQRSSCLTKCPQQQQMKNSRNRNSSRTIPNGKNELHDVKLQGMKTVHVTSTLRNVSTPHDHVSSILHDTEAQRGTSLPQVTNRPNSTSVGHSMGSRNIVDMMRHNSKGHPQQHKTITRHNSRLLHGTAVPHGRYVPHAKHFPHGTNPTHIKDVQHSTNAPHGRSHSANAPHGTGMPYASSTSHITTSSSYTTSTQNKKSVPNAKNVLHNANSQHSTRIPLSAKFSQRTASLHGAVANQSTNASHTTNVSQNAVASQIKNSPWSLWSECSVSCGNGTQVRIKRNIRIEQPIWETKMCSEKECPPRWTEWGEWGACDATCGSARRYRRRRCIGNACKGSAVSMLHCRVPPCATASAFATVDVLPQSNQRILTWSAWSSWSKCSVKCGGGVSRRIRVCPLASRCFGASSNMRTCNTFPCSQISFRL